ncbi:MAG: hypothetical protein WBM99_08285 [Psychromonas sp.]
MNMKKTKIALALGGLIFLAAPLSSVFADEKHNEMKEMQMDCSIKEIKNELRSYVEGVKSNDTQKMQQHLNELLTLSNLPAMDHSAMEHSTMDHSEMQMDHVDMVNKAMPAMDHSTMDHSTMEQSAMDHSEMQMDHANMENDAHDMSTMAGMEGMSPAQHQHIMCMQGIAGLNNLFKQLDQTQDKTEIKLILGKIKEHLKMNQQFFS